MALNSRCSLGRGSQEGRSPPGASLPATGWPAALPPGHPSAWGPCPEAPLPGSSAARRRCPHRRARPPPTSASGATRAQGCLVCGQGPPSARRAPCLLQPRGPRAHPSAARRVRGAPAQRGRPTVAGPGRPFPSRVRGAGARTGVPRRPAPSLPSGAEGRPDVSGVPRAERPAWRGAEGQRGAQQVRRGAADARVGDGPATRGRKIPFRLSVRRENGNVSLPPSV